jgi:hypothetical protein
MVAALYVLPRGVYFGLPDVDPWDRARDARLYPGPWPVVAHPPCERWGRYWHGGPSVRVRKTKGDDAGCFAAALAAVRRWGGVLEHPQASAAWAAFDLNEPPFWGGWVNADQVGGWTCCVEQGHYGHRARKATWLYAAHVHLPSLKWGPSASTARIDDGCHSAEERRLFMTPPPGLGPELRSRRRAWLARRAAITGKEMMCPERMGKRERAATPPAFRDLLLGMARSKIRIGDESQPTKETQPLSCAAANGTSKPGAGNGMVPSPSCPTSLPTLSPPGSSRR